MHSNLFIKVFLAFWMVTCAVLGTWMLASQYFDERPTVAAEHAPKAGTSPPRFMLRTLYQLQNLELEELQGVLRHAKDRHRVDIYLLDANGTEIFSRPVPSAVQALAKQLEGSRQRVSNESAKGRLTGHKLYRSDAGPIRAIFSFAQRKGALMALLGESPGLRVLLAIFTSGLICFALSRVLTRRLKVLQLASRQLATGDFDTRLSVRNHGGDETDELARDFNTMAAQLQERIQAQKRLLGDVSHELRSPLARLRIALALAQEDKSGRTAHLARIEREAQRLEELIGQLLSSAASDIELDSHIDLVALLQQLCEDAAFEGRSQNQTVDFRNELTLAIVQSHGDLLHKCFDNIIRNALAHSGENTEVRVTLTMDNDNFKVRIEDQGPGIPATELKKVFDPFYRVDTTRTRSTGGFGLGLSIAHRAVAQHDGAISAHNTGRGLEIVVQLPVDMSTPA